MRKKMSRSQIETDPNAVWNAFVGILSYSEPSHLESRQKPAHFAFWYSSEVNNGGHFQYFMNRGTSVVPETIQSLHSLGAEQQADVLSDARAAFDHLLLPPTTDAGSYLKAEDQAGLGKFDRRFAECEPNIVKILEVHLHEHLDWYIRIVDE